MGPPPVPAGLRDPGAELWREILSDLDVAWELDSRELRPVAHACRCADEPADLEAAIDGDGVTVIGSRNQTVTIQRSPKRDSSAWPRPARWLEAGVHPKVVSERLGHARPV